MIRQDFIAGGAVAAAAPVLVAAAPRSRFSRTAFEAVLAKRYRHRQVFASTRLADGAVLHYMENSLKAYAVGFGEGPGTLHAAAVLYGSSLTLALDDGMWQKYRLADELASPAYGESLDASAHERNPYRERVAALVRDGASFFVCNNALGAVAAALAQRDHGESSAVHEDLGEHLLPGAMIVPAGVAALNAAQEARFTLVQATIG